MPISPPTVCLSFGSLGDILAVLQLAWDLRAALDESAGASAELRALVSDVDAFTRALQDVQANIERRRRNLRPDVVNGIAAALSRCRNVLGAIQQRIARARGQTSSSGWQQYWGAAAWSILGGKKDVEALRARLSEQLGIMQLYLSLSQANNHEQVKDVLVANRTTLQRIYTVVQDIQLRFDVGVPGFKFYDKYTERYYPPLARTSLQRLRDACTALRLPVDEEPNSFWMKESGITEEDFKNLSVIPTQATITINVGHFAAPVIGTVAGYFFREAAFGEWQVLVGTVWWDLYSNRILKTLLERDHMIGTACNCPVACGTRYRDDLNAMIRRTEMLTAYSEVVSLVFEHLQPAGLEPGWLDSLMTAFFDRPDPDYLLSTVPTVLSRQRLSPGGMVHLIANAPKDRTPAHPLGYVYEQHAITFSAHGASLCESLAGPVLPISPETVQRQVRLPDWAYISFDCRRNASLATNLNKECGCDECTQATSSCGCIEPPETPEM